MAEDTDAGRACGGGPAGVVRVVVGEQHAAEPRRVTHLADVAQPLCGPEPGAGVDQEAAGAVPDEVAVAVVAIGPGDFVGRTPDQPHVVEHLARAHGAEIRSTEVHTS